MRAVALVLILLFVSSCSGPCTLIGCVNEVTFVLTPATRQAFVVGEGVTVKVCVGAVCETGVVTVTATGGSSSSTNPAVWLVPGTGELSHTLAAPVTGPQEVSIELSKGGAPVGSETRSGVTFTETRPNGPGCAPVCQRARLTL